MHRMRSNALADIFKTLKEIKAVTYLVSVSSYSIFPDLFRRCKCSLPSMTRLSLRLSIFHHNLPSRKEPKLFSEDERIKKLKGHILNNIRIKGEIINLIKHNSKKREKRKKGNKKKWAKKSNAVENELTLVHKLRAPVIPRCVSVFQTNWVRSATENADLSVYSQSAAVLLPGLQLAVASLTPERPCE